MNNCRITCKRWRPPRRQWGRSRGESSNKKRGHQRWVWIFRLHALLNRYRSKIDSCLLSIFIISWLSFGTRQKTRMATYSTTTSRPQNQGDLLYLTKKFLNWNILQMGRPTVGLPLHRGAGADRSPAGDERVQQREDHLWAARGSWGEKKGWNHPQSYAWHERKSWYQRHAWNW